MDLNHIDNILYVQDNIIIFNENQTLDESIKASKEVLGKSSQHGKSAFVPKSQIFDYVGKLLMNHEDFQKYFEI
tara:strand:+ start:561 stop:782 length:222 start_codon:yes stop_codon:yes gene_type:complete